jgi:hypothetical protein
MNMDPDENVEKVCQDAFHSYVVRPANGVSVNGYFRWV